MKEKLEIGKIENFELEEGLNEAIKESNKIDPITESEKEKFLGSVSTATDFLDASSGGKADERVLKKSPFLVGKLNEKNVKILANDLAKTLVLSGIKMPVIKEFVKIIEENSKTFLLDGVNPISDELGGQYLDQNRESMIEKQIEEVKSLIEIVDIDIKETSNDDKKLETFKNHKENLNKRLKELNSIKNNIVNGVTEEDVKKVSKTLNEENDGE